MWAIYLAGLIILEAVADIFVKEHSLKHTAWTFGAGILGYVLANVCWLISMRYHSNLALGASIFAVSSGLLGVLIGHFGYHEMLSPRHWVGIGLGVVSLLFLFGD